MQKTIVFWLLLHSILRLEDKISYRVGKVPVLVLFGTSTVVVPVQVPTFPVPVPSHTCKLGLKSMRNS